MWYKYSIKIKEVMFMRRLKDGDVVHCKSMEEYKQLKEICRRDGVIINISDPQLYGEETCYKVVTHAHDMELYYGEKSNFRAVNETIYSLDYFKNYGELTFLEVMRNIKEGETWVCTEDYYDIKSINLEGGYILINRSNEGKGLTIGKDTRFNLSIEYVTFTEAFKEYNNGKTIMSQSGTKYKKHPILKVMFNEDEIDGKWVIIDEQ